MGEKVHQQRWWILAVLCLSLLIIVVDNSILNVALPTLARPVSQGGLDATTSQLQWMVDAYTLVFAGLLLTAGSLGDRFGRRGALQVGLTVFGLGSLLSAMANSPSQLIASRALMGIGGAFIMPGTLSLITSVFEGRERGRAIAIWAGVAGLAVAIGPVTGGFLLEHFYWGSIFLVNLPIVAVALGAGVLIMPTSKDPTAPRLDLVGAALSIAGLVSLVYAFIEAPTEGWSDTKILGALGIAAVLLVTFFAWERRSTHPMLNLDFFKNPRFTSASASISILFFAMFGVIFLLTQYFQFVLGYTPLEAGIRLLPLAATMMVVAPLSARIVERIGTKVVVSTGLFLSGLGVLSFTQFEVSTGYENIFWRLMLMAVGMGLTMAPATESIMGSLPLAKAGVGSAVNDTTRQVGGALGVAIIGSVLASTYGSQVGDAVAGQPLPNGVANDAKNSLGFALETASRLGGPAGNALAETARTAFVDGMHQGYLVGAAALIVGAIAALIWLPARARRPVEELEAEYEAKQPAAPGATPEETPTPVDAPTGTVEPAYVPVESQERR
ncbi:MAG TPA: MFS transporter [Acidimicrobiia bacterium]|nr:MFS transporter [Acidimicrobiia bacterium]